jgi:hypothetical protein
MLKGYAILIEKMPDGTRLIDLAIIRGMQGYRRHYPNTKIEDMVGLVNPKMYEKCELADRTGDGLTIIPDKGIPFRELWICKKERDNV